MKEQITYIFRSGELYLADDNALPIGIPERFSGLVSDVFPIVIGGARAVVCLLDEKKELPLPAVGQWVKLRFILGSPDPALVELAPRATKALGLANWHHATRFCSRCGGSLADHASEVARQCAACGTVYYPRLSPAIITVVEKGDKILLARHSYRNQDMFTCVAGFLEHGETLEECVAREVREEIGIEVRDVRYKGSQSWPFPDQYMLAFTAQWASGEIQVDHAEIDEARWFSRDALPNTPSRGTVAWRLIHGDFDASSKN